VENHVKTLVRIANLRITTVTVHIYSSGPTTQMHCFMLIQILGLYTFSIPYLEAGGEEMTT